MTKLTVEETNLLSIYKTGSRQGLIVAMNAALPFMDGEILKSLSPPSLLSPAGQSRQLYMALSVNDSNRGVS